MGKGIKYTTAEVVSMVEGKGFKLLSDSYVNMKSKLNVCCSCGNSEWITCLDTIMSGHTCPKCGYKRAGGKSHQTRILKHPLLDKYPVLCSEWDYIKNKGLRPENFSYLDGLSVWWICQFCHKSYSASIYGRSQENSGCLKCSAKRRGESTSLRMFNKEISLGISYPNLISEWDYEKNNNLSPYEVYRCTNKKYYWLCNKGHSYLSSVSGRTSGGSGCPICKKSKGELKIEKYLISNNFYYTPQYKIFNCRHIRPLPFDFAIFNDADKNTLVMLIEYDGELHFKKLRKVSNSAERLAMIRAHDEIKNKYCIDNGITLIRIPYWEKNQIEIILEEKFSQKGGLME